MEELGWVREIGDEVEELEMEGKEGMVFGEGAVFQGINDDLGVTKNCQSAKLTKIKSELDSKDSSIVLRLVGCEEGSGGKVVGDLTAIKVEDCS